MTLKVIDSHLHIWDPAVQDLPWLASLPALQHRYTVDDLAAHYARQGVDTGKEHIGYKSPHHNGTAEQYGKFHPRLHTLITLSLSGDRPRRLR